MAKENVKAFFDKVEADPALYAEMTALGNEPAILKLAEKCGLPFTSEEWSQVRNTRPQRTKELSASELGATVEGTKLAKKDCCYWAYDCMPGFVGKP